MDRAYGTTDVPICQGEPFDEESLIQEALQNIYNSGVDVKNQIEPNLYKITAKTYRKAVDEGFGTVKFGQPDYGFVQALRQNTDVLAAFKTHRQQNDIAALMLDGEGKLKPFGRFRKDVEGIIGKYNRDWLATEYNTAVIRARHAARWKDFERDADLYPNLKWLETTSPHPDTKIHIRFWNRIWAITDPFWKKHFPGDRWNCKCGLTNTDEPVTDNSDVYREEVFKTEHPAEGIDSNSGLTGEIFTRTHPYIKEAYDGAQIAVERQMLKVRAKEIREEATATLKGMPLNNAGFEKIIRVTTKGIKEFLNQPHEHYAQKNEMLLRMQTVISEARYMGCGTDKHDPDVKVHLFETLLEGKKSWIIVKEYPNGETNLYSISDSENILRVLKEK